MASHRCGGDCGSLHVVVLRFQSAASFDFSWNVDNAEATHQFTCADARGLEIITSAADPSSKLIRACPSRRLTIVVVATSPIPQSKSADPVSQFLVSRPQGGDVIVSRSRSTIYDDPGSEGLYAIITNYLVQIQNNRLVSWDNHTDGTQKYTQQYTTELKVIDGSEVSKSVGLSASFLGLTISAGYSQKTFSSTETTNSKTETTEVEVAPRSDLFFYQRQYVMRSDVYFILDAWKEEWIVGSWHGYDISHARCDEVIDSSDYVTMDAELKGETTIKVDAAKVMDFGAGKKVRRFENLTEKAQKTLRAMGVNGL
ncbi:hypothetical protein DFH11DRAFT_1553051 [Phellopilus nigrolimitatus]|nr:hypothetical protein DFH11DRAFT_1553051 [Phellopilus nigrolimitatus]